MRIADNRLGTLLDFFHSELSGIYEESEISAMAAEATRHYLGVSPASLLRNREMLLNQSDLLRLYDCAKRLRAGEAFQYVLGASHFYGLTFLMNPSVLIPRPETEELIDMVVKENKNVRRLLDIGTGSGCIAVSLAAGLKGCDVYACDVSGEVLDLAKLNALKNKVKVRFFNCDVLKPGSLEQDGGEKFDIVVSNPPYVLRSEEDTLASQVREQEPHLALFVEGNDPIIFYRKIIDSCRYILKPGGALYFELNPLTAERVLDHAVNSGLFIRTELLKDMSGNIRFFKAVIADL